MDHYIKRHKANPLQWSRMLAVQIPIHWQVSLCGPIVLKGNTIFVVSDFCGQLSMKVSLRQASSCT